MKKLWAAAPILAILACSNASAQTAAERPASLSCALEVAPEGFTARLYEEFVAGILVDRTEDGIGNRVEDGVFLFEQCGQEYDGDDDKIALWTQGAIGVHLRTEASSRLNAFGLDTARIDDLFLPFLATLEPDQLRLENFQPPSSMQEEVRAMVGETIEESGAAPRDVAGAFTAYFVGLVGETGALRGL